MKGANGIVSSPLKEIAWSLMKGVEGVEVERVVDERWWRARVKV